MVKRRRMAVMGYLKVGKRGRIISEEHSTSTITHALLNGSALPGSFMCPAN